MSDSPENAWSDNPYAPQILYILYLNEKVVFAGNLLGAILYGIVIIFFFQCMGALLNPVDRKTRGIKWGLVAHTAAMFSAFTINAAMSLDLPSISYIDNRDFPGTRSAPVAGPYGYQWVVISDAISVIPSAMFFVNTCLADGFLLYRCYVICSRNYWAMILACMTYLASTALGIVYIYYQSLKYDTAAWDSIVAKLELPAYLVSLSLNVLLTLMIAIRLIRHSKNIRNALGPAMDNGMYKTVVTILVESCLLYAVASIVCIGLLGSKNVYQGISLPIFGNIQVIGPFLIILRVANRTALTSDTVASGDIGSIRFKSRGVSTGGGGTLPDGDPMTSVGTDWEVPGEPGAGVEKIIEEVPL